jgi:hypothetical protein
MLYTLSNLLAPSQQRSHMSREPDPTDLSIVDVLLKLRPSQDLASATMADLQSDHGVDITEHESDFSSDVLAGMDVLPSLAINDFQPLLAPQPAASSGDILDGGQDAVPPTDLATSYIPPPANTTREARAEPIARGLYLEDAIASVASASAISPSLLAAISNPRPTPRVISNTASPSIYIETAYAVVDRPVTSVIPAPPHLPPQPPPPQVSHSTEPDTANEYRAKLSQWGWCCLVMAVVIAVALTVILTVAQSSSLSSQAPMSPMAPLAPSMTLSRAQQGVAFINDITLINQTLVPTSKDATTLPLPEELALRWLIDHDTDLNLVPTTPSNRFRLQQRYACSISWQHK